MKNIGLKFSVTVKIVTKKSKPSRKESLPLKEANIKKFLKLYSGNICQPMQSCKTFFNPNCITNCHYCITGCLKKAVFLFPFRPDGQDVASMPPALWSNSPHSLAGFNKILHVFSRKRRNPFLHHGISFNIIGDSSPYITGYFEAFGQPVGKNHVQAHDSFLAFNSSRTIIPQQKSNPVLAQPNPTAEQQRFFQPKTKTQKSTDLRGALLFWPGRKTLRFRLWILISANSYWLM